MCGVMDMFESITFEPLLTPSEAAMLLRIHTKTILRWAKMSVIPSHRLGRKVAFRSSDLNSWLNSRYSNVVTRAAQPKGLGDTI